MWMWLRIRDTHLPPKEWEYYPGPEPTQSRETCGAIPLGAPGKAQRGREPPTPAPAAIGDARGLLVRLKSLPH